MFKKIGITLLTAFFLLPTQSVLAVDVSQLSTISVFNTYGEMSQTIYFKISNPTSNCHAYFMSNSSSLGYDVNFSSLLSAFHNKKNVVVYGDDTELWAGSSSPTCKMKVLSVRD